MSSQDDRRPVVVIPLWALAVILVIVGVAVALAVREVATERSQNRACHAQGGNIARTGHGHYFCIAPDGRVIGHG